jgi:hypothetical protein
MDHFSSLLTMSLRVGNNAFSRSNLFPMLQMLQMVSA